jgi:hypothetical protein
MLSLYAFVYAFVSLHLSSGGLGILINNVGIANQYPELLVEHSDKVTKEHNTTLGHNLEGGRGACMYVCVSACWSPLTHSPITHSSPPLSLSLPPSSAAHHRHDQLQHGLHRLHVSRRAESDGTQEQRGHHQCLIRQWQSALALYQHLFGHQVSRAPIFIIHQNHSSFCVLLSLSLSRL